MNDYPDCEKGSSPITDNHKEEEAIEEQKRSDLTSNDIIEIQCLNGGKLAGKLLENSPLNDRKNNKDCRWKVCVPGRLYWAIL